MPNGLRPLAPVLWVAQSSLYATNSGIWLSEDSACLVDPGVTPDEIETLARFLASRSISDLTIVLTHAHWDHLLGAARFPAAQVIAQAAYEDVRQRHGSDLTRQVAQWDEQCGARRVRSFQPPVPTRTFGSSERLAVGALGLQLRPAPGHTLDQCVVYEPCGGILWAADMLSDQELPSVSYCLDAYERTLTELAALDVALLIPGHGAPSGDREEIRRRFDEDQAYLAQLRECVQSALDAGCPLGQTLRVCAVSCPARSAADALTARWNIETVYVELGGRAVPPVGWDREWAAEEPSV